MQARQEAEHGPPGHPRGNRLTRQYERAIARTLEPHARRRPWRSTLAGIGLLYTSSP